MNIALIAHDTKKELMVQFCIAYCGILSHHKICATGATGKLVGDLPMDKGAYNKYFAGTLAIGAAAVFAVQYLFWLL